MDTLSLRSYLNSMPPLEQQDFAERCGTTISYLRKTLSIRSRISIELCINIERESKGTVLAETLRPDFIEGWKYIRGTTKRLLYASAPT